MGKIVCILVLIFTTKLRAQDKYTIQDVINTSLQNNPKLKQSHIREDASAIMLKETKMIVYPRLNARSSSSLNFGRNIDPFTNQFLNKKIEAQTGGVYFELPIFSGFAKLNEILLRKHEMDISKSFSKKLQDELILNVLVTYLNALQDREILKTSQKQVELTKAHLEIEKKLHISGYKTIADISLASVQVSKSEISAIKAQHQLKKSLRELCRLMNISFDTKIELIEPDLSVLNTGSIDYSISKIFLSARRNSGVLMLAASNIAAAEKAIDIAKAQRLPNVSFVGNIHSGYSSEGTRSVFTSGGLTREKASYLFQLERNYNQSMGVNITIPIISAGTRLKLKRLSLNITVARLEEENIKNELYFAIQEALSDVKLAEQQILFQEEVLNSSKIMFSAISKRHNLRLVNAFTFAESLASLYEAEIEVIKAKYNLLFKRKIIDFYQSQPISF